MPNEHVNKVILGTETLLDLTGDTAEAADVAAGKSFHLRSGAQATGTASYAGAPVNNGNANATNAILYGTVDSTSTSTAYTATVDGLTELTDGTCVMLKNGVVTSAANFTINVNNLGAKPVYSNMAAATRETTIFNVNYTLLFVYDSTRVEGGCWVNYRGYYSDANSIGYQLRTNSGTLPTTAKFYRYRILFTSADGTHWVPSNTSTSTNATAKRDVIQTPINPFGPIVYYGTTAAIEANANVSAAQLWQQYAVTFGYSFNRTGAALVLTYPAPVYLKCAPQANGSAIIDADTPYVQALPSTEDGKIYIFLGIAYSATAVEVRAEHPIYWHDGTGIRIWTGAEPSSVEPSSTTPSMDGTAAVGTATTYARADHVHPTDTSRATAADLDGKVDASVTSDSQTTTVDNLGSSVRMTSTNGNKYADIQVGRSGNASVSLYAGQGTNDSELVVMPTGVTIYKLATPTTDTMPTTKQYVDDGLSNKQDTLVSGTNIKTVNGNSLLGSGDIAISGGISAISLNTPSEPYDVPVSSGTATIDIGDGLKVSDSGNKATLSAKIKTVNNTSLLGSGDVAVQPTLVSGTNIKTVNGNSLLGSGDLTIGGSVTMEDTAVDAAVEAAWPAPTGYQITADDTYVQNGNLLGIGDETLSIGSFIESAGEGETVYVLSVGGHWEPDVTIDSSGASVSYSLYGPGPYGGTLYTFTMPAEAVTVSMWYND